MPSDDPIRTRRLSAKEMEHLLDGEVSASETASAARGASLAVARDALLVTAESGVLSAVERLLEREQWKRDASTRLLDVMTEDLDSRVLGQESVEQVRLQAKAREYFIESYPTASSAEVADLYGSGAENRSALANRWKKEGRIFAIPVQGTDRFPRFQFDEHGRPLPVIAEVLRWFEGENGWTVALWFASANGWLGGEPPAARLTADPGAVVEAARRSGTSQEG